jgi:uncharacterized SAM-binding protein YcdF (DUF218 family)
MVAGADLVRYFISGGGIVWCFLIAAVWIIRSPHSKHARVFLLIAALAYTAASAYGPQYLIAHAMSRPLAPFKATDARKGVRTAVVVLGSGSVAVEDWNGRKYSFVDHSAAARVLEAVRVFRMVDHAIVISSGGKPHPDDNEKPSGETMRDALVTLGVPPDRIVIEAMSKTTRDEAVIVRDMLRSERIEQTILVTSETHMRRALGAFRSAGVEAIPAIANEFDRDVSWTQFIVPSDDGLWVASLNAHEVLGIAYYWMRGWWSIQDARIQR